MVVVGNTPWIALPGLEPFLAAQRWTQLDTECMPSRPLAYSRHVQYYSCVSHNPISMNYLTDSFHESRQRAHLVQIPAQYPDDVPTRFVLLALSRHADAQSSSSFSDPRCDSAGGASERGVAYG